MVRGAIFPTFEELPDVMPIFPLAGALLLLAAPCRSIFSSRATSP
jgi:hypothetical protein